MSLTDSRQLSGFSQTKKQPLPVSLPDRLPRPPRLCTKSFPRSPCQEHSLQASRYAHPPASPLNPEEYIPALPWNRNIGKKRIRYQSLSRIFHKTYPLPSPVSSFFFPFGADFSRLPAEKTPASRIHPISSSSISSAEEIII